jgi:hypothetical protein
MRVDLDCLYPRHAIMTALRLLLKYVITLIRQVGPKKFRTTMSALPLGH